MIVPSFPAQGFGSAVNPGFEGVNDPSTYDAFEYI